MPGRLDDLDLDLNGDKLREECGVFGIMRLRGLWLDIRLCLLD